jgi:hypothetical protein
MMAAAEGFLAKHLGGRFQEGGTPEVVARLNEITVDPKTVVLAKKVDANSVGSPKPVTDLVAGTLTYAGTIAAGGQNMPISTTRVVKKFLGRHDTAKLPMGEAVDTVTVQALVPLKRVVSGLSIDSFLDGR